MLLHCVSTGNLRRDHSVQHFTPDCVSYLSALRRLIVPRGAALSPPCPLLTVSLPVLWSSALPAVSPPTVADVSHRSAADITAGVGACRHSRDHPLMKLVIRGDPGVVQSHPVRCRGPLVATRPGLSHFVTGFVPLSLSANPTRIRSSPRRRAAAPLFRCTRGHRFRLTDHLIPLPLTETTN